MANSDKKQRDREWYLKNKEAHLARCKRYREQNKEKISNKKKEWVATNRKKYNQYYVDRWKSDLNFKLAHFIRKTVNRYIRCDDSSMEQLGCSIDEFRIYIESKWQPGMSWANYGLKGWHIDHVVALSNFVLSDSAQFMAACHYTNLQPLWAKDNLSKGSK